MKFFCIRHSLTIHNALVKYNKGKQRQYHTKDVRVLFVITLIPFSNRSRILAFLGRTGHIMNYKQLDRCLSFLEAENLIQKDKASKKRFSITPEGYYFLTIIEESSRKMRLDKIG
jgi:hypothetical protein